MPITKRLKTAHLPFAPTPIPDLNTRFNLEILKTTKHVNTTKGTCPHAMTIFPIVGTLYTKISHTLSACRVHLLNSKVPGKGQGSFVHSRHVGDPETLEYVPVPQSAQTVDEEAEYFPASQLMQTDEPAFCWYLPAPQSPQVEATLAPTASENLPASQLVQAAELVCAVKPENFPASQLVH
jgi:hypothetical protein